MTDRPAATDGSTPPTAPINETVEDRKFMIWALANRMGRPPTIEEAKDFLAGDFDRRKNIWLTKKGN